MDSWQAPRQLAEQLLSGALWAESPYNAVLTGGAFVSEDLDGDFIPREAFLQDGPVVKSLPFARVSVISEEPDQESPGRSIMTLRAWVVAGGGGITDATTVASQTAQDTHGINQDVGANRAGTSPQGKSTGRHVDEVCNRLVESLNYGQLVDSTHGMQGVVRVKDKLVTVSGVQVLARPVDIQVFNGTTAKRYHDPRRFTATAGIAGACSLSWLLPPTRFDTLGMVVCRSAAGGGYPSGPTDGTPLTLSGALATSVALTGLPAGAYKFTAFMGYAETKNSSGVQGSTADRYSSGVNCSVTVT